MTKPATLRAVADLAGVSTATASKALNGLPVSTENLARVRDAAEHLGYVANSAARSMRQAQTMTIGIVMNMNIHPGTELIRILNSTILDLEQAGYTILLSVGGSDHDEVDVALRRLIERRVDGLFYWNARPAKSLALYRERRIPVLAVGFRDDACVDLPLITVDTTRACREVMRHLKSLGHRVVAELAGEDRPGITESAAIAAGLDYRRPVVRFDQADVERYVASLATTPDAPTALISDYSSVLQILLACESIGLRIPDDLTVLSTTDSEGAALLRTPLSAMDTDYSMMGHACAAAMLQAINGDMPSDVILQTGFWWTDRESVGPVAPGRR